MKITLLKKGILKDLFGLDFELIETGFNDGNYNMQFDWDRTVNCSKGNSLPMFRLYGWEPYCVSLGANQKEDEINFQKCKELGFDIVRRPTGGRAVLHAEELTYSFVIPVNNNLNVHDIYKHIHQILLESFTTLGCENLEFEKSQPDFRKFYSEPGKSISCFASSARYEIALNGRKIVGSAQRLYDRTLLQHGSILLGSSHELLADVSNVQSEEQSRKLKEFIHEHSITLSEACKRKIYFEECEESIVDRLDRN